MNSQSAQTRLTSASLLSLLFVLICTKNVWAQTAVEILQASGVQGGLVVVLGCDDTELLTALRSQDACLVQGLDADPAKVKAARRTVQQEKGTGAFYLDHSFTPSSAGRVAGVWIQGQV